MVTVIMKQPGPEVKCEQSEILLTHVGQWFHKLPELLELFRVKLLAAQPYLIIVTDATDMSV